MTSPDNININSMGGVGDAPVAYGLCGSQTSSHTKRCDGNSPPPYPMLTQSILTTCSKGIMASEEREYVVPREHDVLCGRGRLFFEHSGNRRFRTIIEQWLSKYSSADTKSEKTCFVRMVVNEIASKGGRFLKLEKSNSMWYEGDSVCAKSKVGHAFRDLIAEQPLGQPIAQGREVSSSYSTIDEETENDSDDTGASEGASLVRKYGKTDSVKGTRASEVTIGATQQEERPKAPEPKAIVRQAQISSLNNTQGVVQTTKYPIEVVSSNSKASVSRSVQRASSLATVKKFMLQTLMVRQQALAKGKEFPEPLETKSSLGGGSKGSTKKQDCSTSTLQPPEDRKYTKAEQMTPVVPIPLRREANQASSTPKDISVPPALKSRLSFPPSTRANQAPIPSSNKSRRLSDPRKAEGVRPSSIQKPSAPRGQNTNVNLRSSPMIPNMMSMHRGLPGMLDAQDLKRAMLQTLARRQHAIEQQGSTMGLSSDTGQAHVNTLLQRAKATRPSASEILQQAMAVQTTSTSSGESYRASRSDLLQRALVAQSAAINVHADLRQTKNQDYKKHPPATHLPTSLFAKIVSPETSTKDKVVCSHELKSAVLPVTSRMKRRRSSYSSRTMETKKKSRPLAAVAHDNTLRSQVNVGPCLGSSMGFVDENKLYFL
mmetsp:Transcript_19426/g.32262  ORF Transcript_19426/g.32262 Transcript_19426/m.32262 type:complete len:658 (-) Transcript_19426:17-1990(-)